MIITTLPIEHRIKRLEPIFTIDKSSTAIATGGLNGEMKYWSPDCMHIKTIKKHAGSVSTVRFSRDGTLLASAGDDGYVYIFKHTESDPIHAIKHPIDATHVTWSEEFLFSSDLDGNIFVTRVADFSVHRKLKSPYGGITGLAVSPNGEYLAAYSEDVILLYRRFELVAEHATEEGTILESLSSRLSFSPDGKFLSVGLQFNNKAGTVDIFDSSLERCFSLVGHVAPSEVTCFNPSFFRLPGDEARGSSTVHSVIAVASQDLALSFWSTANSRPFLLIKNFTESPILDMYWDMSDLVACSYDGRVKRVSFGRAFGELIGAEHAFDDALLPFSLANLNLAKEEPVIIEELREDEKPKEYWTEDKGVITKCFDSTTDKTIIHDSNNSIVPDGNKNKTISLDSNNSIVPDGNTNKTISLDSNKTEQSSEKKRIKPSRITSQGISQDQTDSKKTQNEDRSIILFDTELPERLRIIRTEPFVAAVGEISIEVDSSLRNLTVKRSGTVLYLVNGPVNKVCFNEKLLVFYSTTLQVYDILTGCLILPHISVKAAFLSLLGNEILVVSTSGDFRVLDVATAKAVKGNLPKTKNLKDVKLDKQYFLVAEYAQKLGSCDEILYYHKRMKLWMVQEPVMNSIKTQSTDYLNDVDETPCQLEAVFQAAKHAKDKLQMQTVLMRFVRMVCRLGRISGRMEYQLESMLTAIRDRKVVKEALRRLNTELGLQRFVEKHLEKINE